MPLEVVLAVCQGHHMRLKKRIDFHASRFRLSGKINGSEVCGVLRDLEERVLV